MNWRKLIWGIFFCTKAMGQPSHLQVGNAYVRSGAYSNHFMDAFSFTSNPACLGSMKFFLCGLIAERKWMLKELEQEELSVSGKLGKGGFGIALKQNGDADYCEQQATLAFGKNLGRLELGIRFDYLQAQAAGYGRVCFGSAGIGFRYHFSDQFIAGWEMELPAWGSAGKENSENGSQVFKMGFGYELRPDVFLSFQIDKFSDEPVNLTGLVEYRYGEQFFFSFGVQGHEAAPFFKSGWKKNQICVQFYVSYQPLLGYSPGLVFLWEGKNKKG